MKNSGTRECIVDGCKAHGRTRGMCPMHYQRWVRHGDPTMGGPPRKRKPPQECSVPGCHNFSTAKGLCHKHYAIFLRHGDTKTIGGKRAKWDQEIIDDQGYVLLPIKDHPNSRLSGRVPKHRYVMSEFLGRPLFENENIHHKNGDKTDNRLENLELWVVAQPKGQRPPDLLEYARKIIERYGHEESKFNDMYRTERDLAQRPKLKIVSSK